MPIPTIVATKNAISGEFEFECLDRGNVVPTTFNDGVSARDGNRCPWTDPEDYEKRIFCVAHGFFDVDARNGFNYVEINVLPTIVFRDSTGHGYANRTTRKIFVCRED